MLTKDQIKAKLKENASWEPSDSASDQEWEAYDEAYRELEENGELPQNKWDDDDDDEGDNWSDD